MNSTLTKHEQKSNEIINRDRGIVTEQDCANNSGRIYSLSGGVFVSRETSRTVPHQFVGSSLRGAIESFSPGSGLRMRKYLRECMAEYTAMVTLTYPFCFPTNGPETKEHLRRFIQELKRRCPESEKERFSCFWFMEFQSRGAPHYHLFITYLPEKSWVSKTWYNICNTEDERHLRAGTKTEVLRRGRAGTISYASKYAAKQEQKVVPEGFEKVGRFWGISGVRTRLSAATFVSRSDASKEFVLNIVKSMKSHVLKCVKEGKAKVICRNEKSFVVVFLNPLAQLKMYGFLARIQLQTMCFSNIFMDAEIDL